MREGRLGYLQTYLEPVEDEDDEDDEEEGRKYENEDEVGKEYEYEVGSRKYLGRCIMG